MNPKLMWQVWMEPVHELIAVFRDEEDARQFIVDILVREKYVVMNFHLEKQA